MYTTFHPYIANNIIFSFTFNYNFDITENTDIEFYKLNLV